MSGTESKETGAGNAAAEEHTELDKGKQPVVAGADEEVADVPDSDNDDQDEDDADAQDKGEGEGAAGSSGKKKKKSKRKKVKAALTGKPDDQMAQVKSVLDKLPQHDLQDLISRNPALLKDYNGDSAKAAEAFKKLSLNEVMTGLALSGKNAKDMASYKFWKTQPVPRFDEEMPKDFKEGPLKVQTVDDVPKEPPKLGIEGFEWVTMDLTNDDEIKEVYQLLNGHYVEDDESMFRFNYGTAILKWALMSPGWSAEWHVGIRDCRLSTKKPLVAFISAVPVNLRVRNNIIRTSEVNFLCVHKKLRNKRLTPILIKEVTRRSNLQEIWQGVYTAGIVLPKPVSTCRYYHRALDWKKLYDIGFSPLPPNSKPEWQIRKYTLPEKTTTKGLREMTKKDVPAVHKLMKKYVNRFDMAPEWDEDEVAHWLLQPRGEGDEQVVWSYVVEDEDHRITDFFSFYNLESTVINNPRHKVVRVAYLFYYGTEVGLAAPFNKAATKERLNELVHDALILAKRARFDVFNALSLMDNTLFLEQQKFGPGDGQLHYYLFNYRAKPITGGIDNQNKADEENLSGVGFVML
ncbi:putative glycylpeptide n-tetradecanoyltransferase [Diaporthe ampelina]|uniref:Glycylpeptide N-tetradecanoyltransferase n=1 Tax=Diaporthe ampelina TaxID=1214573 RepID=A0A0G2IFU9_9PEZI|nr:putative glycylpeptide n-tetradecanoyltransferase [Diaporthe ampelina]